MAEEDTELPVPRNEEEEDDIVTPVDPTVWDMVRVVIGFEETIYRLKVPTFTVTPTAIRQKLVWDTHKQAQGVLTKSQLWWYWPYMESEIRRRVRQCETCQASKHGRSP